MAAQMFTQITEPWNRLLDWAAPREPQREVLLGGLAVYLVVNTLLSGHKGLSKSAMKPIVFLHNAALGVYSILTFTSAIQTLNDAGWRLDFLFDTETCSAVHNSRFHALGYLFYLSKFWEFIDTWIVYLKGRNPLFLQTFHHIGAAASMYALVKYRVEVVWIFVTWNSFIHSLMYTYYALTTLDIRPPGKSMLTSMQISQFITGIGMSIPYCFFSCTQDAAYAALLGSIAYVACLIVLFRDFYVKSYGNKKLQRKASAKTNGVKHD